MPVDTGFLVYNESTYPNLCGLFDALAVPTEPSDMSFSVSLSGSGGAGAPRLEWSSGGLAGLLAGGSNALRPGFASMLSDMRRFNAAAPAFLERCAAAAPGAPELALTMAQFLADGRYGAPFTNWYLVPQMAAVWSGSASEVLAFPARTFIQFCTNHSLLQVRQQRPSPRSLFVLQLPPSRALPLPRRPPPPCRCWTGRSGAQ